LSDFIIQIENIAAIIVNTLTIKNGEKSTISNGAITATRPKTKVAHIITDPMRSPKIIQLSPFLAEIIAKYNSGKQFPSPIIKTPTKARETPKELAKKLAVSIITCEDIKSKAKSITSFTTFFIKATVSIDLLLFFLGFL